MTERLLMNSDWDVSLDSQGPAVLLVDENEEDLDRYSKMLSILGYEVHSMDSYARALHSLGRERFDLVIVEQGSTEFEGWAVVRRAFEIDPNVPVLVVARTVDAGCCLKALDSGACEYVQKPLSTTELEQLVSDYLDVPDGNDGNQLGITARLRVA